jgi:hypothetical protein
MIQTKLYKFLKDPIDGDIINVRKNQGNGVYLTIPLEATYHPEYKEYIKWTEAGNTAEAAD